MIDPIPTPRRIERAPSRPLTDLYDLAVPDIWDRPLLSRRERSLITVASLVSSGWAELLSGHLRLARKHGLSEAELTEAMVHLAFYAGLTRATSALQVAKAVFTE